MPCTGAGRPAPVHLPSLFPLGRTCQPPLAPCCRGQEVAGSPFPCCEHSTHTELGPQGDPERTEHSPALASVSQAAAACCRELARQSHSGQACFPAPAFVLVVEASTWSVATIFLSCVSPGFQLNAGSGQILPSVGSSVVYTRLGHSRGLGHVLGFLQILCEVGPRHKASRGKWQGSASPSAEQAA